MLSLCSVRRDTGLLVPLLAAIGVASLVSEYMEGLLSKQLEGLLTEIYLRQKTLFWGAGGGDHLLPPPSGAGGISIVSGGSGFTIGASSSSLGLGMAAKEKTVESVIATPATLYVRHTLPLEQAKSALQARRSPAAVVVDDNFSPMGLVFLEDIEAELVKQELLLAEDDNFNRAT